MNIEELREFAEGVENGDDFITSSRISRAVSKLDDICHNDDEVPFDSLAEFLEAVISTPKPVRED